MTQQKALRLPVVSGSAEHLVRGFLMRRNVLAYEAPRNNEGYDLIAIHPDPRHRQRKGRRAQIRIQVKSRYATDSDRGFPVRESSFGAFDYLVVVFLNIGTFFDGRDGSTGEAELELYTLPRRFVMKHHQVGKVWQRVRLKNVQKQIEKYRGAAGIEQIALELGVARPTKAKSRK